MRFWAGKVMGRRRGGKFVKKEFGGGLKGNHSPVLLEGEEITQ